MAAWIRLLFKHACVVFGGLRCGGWLAFIKGHEGRGAANLCILNSGVVAVTVVVFERPDVHLLFVLAPAAAAVPRTENDFCFDIYLVYAYIHCRCIFFVLAPVMPRKWK